MIEQYEKTLEEKHRKEQERSKKNHKYWKKRYKSDLRFYKNLLKESAWPDFTEEVEERANYSNSKVTDYPFGYSGTWAHDEAGYDNDDIDTIFDGDPDAYWNID